MCVRVSLFLRVTEYSCTVPVVLATTTQPTVSLKRNRNVAGGTYTSVISGNCHVERP